jgi:hypothetical protein
LTYLSLIFLSYLENLVVFCQISESHTLWAKSSHTHTLHALRKLLSLLCLLGNLCLSYPCLSTICLHNFDVLCDYFLKTGVHACAIILLKDLTMLLFLLQFSLMFPYFVLPFCKTCGLHYSIYPSPSETVRGSNLGCVVTFITLFYPLYLCDKKRE